MPRPYGRASGNLAGQAGGLGAAVGVSVGYGLEQTDPNGRTDGKAKGAFFECTAP